MAEYYTKERLISYYNQLWLIKTLGESVKSVLEVGAYKSIMDRLLDPERYNLKRADIDPSLNPDFLIDLSLDFALPKDEFDLIVAFQVLEHIPYADFERALKKLALVSRRYVVISLPYRTRSLAFRFDASTLNYRRPRNLMLQIQEFWSDKPMVTDHAWEMGLRDYPKKRIIQSIQKAGLTIRREYQDPLWPYHYFFVLERIS